jgi:hypothetical protein
MNQIVHTEKPFDPNARQVGGDHYSGSEYQHWDYATDLKMGHLEGAATKYLARAGNKAGATRVSDLEKVEHYLEKLQQVHEFHRIDPLSERQAAAGISRQNMLVARFIKCSMSGHAFTPRAVAALTALSSWSDGLDLADALKYVREELAEERQKPAVDREIRKQEL